MYSDGFDRTDTKQVYNMSGAEVKENDGRCVRKWCCKSRASASHLSLTFCLSVSRLQYLGNSFPPQFLHKADF